MNKKPVMSKFDLAILLTNVLALGALLVLMILRGPTEAIVVLTVGAAAMAIGTIGMAFTKPSR